MDVYPDFSDLMESFENFNKSTEKASEKPSEDKEGELVQIHNTLKQMDLKLENFMKTERLTLLPEKLAIPIEFILPEKPSTATSTPPQPRASRKRRKYVDAEVQTDDFEEPPTKQRRLSFKGGLGRYEKLINSEMAESKEKTQSLDRSAPAASASADMKKEGQGGGKKGDKKKQKHASGDANKMQKKEKPENPDKTTDGAVNQKSKADLKAERRALQEAQRAAKLAKKSEGGGMAAPKKEVRVPDTVKADVEDTQKKIAKKLEKQQIPQRTVTQRKVRLFNHLHQYEKDNALMQQISFTKGIIHPAIIKLGIQYAEGVISGSNARCVALLAALKKVIADYSTPPQKELSRDLEAKIKPYISFLSQCRLMSVSMGNAIKYLKWHITHIPRDMTDSEAKEKLCHRIDDFYQEKIELAGKAISEFARDKISDKDVIVVYACSSLIRKVMLDAHNQGRNFRVVVVDSRPRMEGRELLRRLVKAGIKCSYVLINAASYVMREATKVFLGAYALLANGYVMSRVGTSMLALIAKSCNVPVLVCCETYKFCERVQTDSFVFNELGDPDVVMDVGNKKTHLADWRDHQSLRLLNLLYDVTPPEFVTMVITEMGMIPCTSVPVVLRMKYAEISDS